MRDANKYFFEFGQVFKALKQAFKGRLWRLTGLLLLFALPVAIVNAYTSNSIANSVVAILPTIDFTSQSSVEALLSAYTGGLSANLASYLLSFVLAFLQCAMFIFATVFTYESITGRREMLADSSKFAKLILKKLLVVFLVTYLASYIVSFFLQFCMASASIFLLIPLPLLAIPLALLFCFVFNAVITAGVDSYSSVIIASTSIGRVRFMFSMLYARLLYRGNFLKTVVYYSIICAATSLISIIPTIGAIYLSYVQSPLAIAAWGVSSLVQNLLAGYAMCYYTARMLQLEKKNAALLRPLSFVVSGEDNNG